MTPALRATLAGWALLAVLVLDAAGLALICLFYLPLRLVPSLGGWPLPLVILLAAVVLPLLVSIAARFGPAPPLAVLPPVVWLATVLVFGTSGPGGDRVLVGDWRGLALLAAGLLPAAVALGRVMVTGLPATARTAAPARGGGDESASE